MRSSLASPAPNQRRRRPSSIAGSSRCSRPEQMKQVDLMKGRGDLRGARMSLDVALESPVGNTANPLGSLGLQLTKVDGTACPKLRVSKVDTTYNGAKTSAGVWNSEKNKVQGEAVCAIHPGDWICAVDDSAQNDYDAMLSELAAEKKTRRRHLRVEKEFGTVLAPSRHSTIQSLSSTLPLQISHRKASRPSSATPSMTRSSGSKSSKGSVSSQLSTRAPSPDFSDDEDASSVLSAGYTLSEVCKKVMGLPRQSS